MAISPTVVLRACGAAGLLIAWALFAHYASAEEGNSDVAAALAGASMLAVVALLLWRVRNRCWLVVGTLATTAVLVGCWRFLRGNVALLYYLQHVGANLALAVLFGRSLFGNGDPLVTHFARLAHYGVLTDAQLRYTRRVTVAWTVFFVTTAALSTALFVFSTPTAWSVFANLLGLPLLGLMFAGEYLFRHRLLPPADCTSIADTIRGYRASLRDKRSLAEHQ